MSFITVLFSLFSVVNGMFEYTIGLKQENVDKLYEYAEDVSDFRSPNYGQYWSQEQIDTLVSPSKQKNVGLSYWLNNFTGLTVTHDYGDALRGVSENDITNELKELFYLNNQSDMYLNMIDFIEGPPIVEVENNHTHYTPDSGIVSREVLQNLYNIPTDMNLSSSIGLIEYQNGSGFDPANLNASQYYNNETANPVTAVHTVGNDGFSDTETELDLQMASQVSENATLWFWGSPNWLYTFAVNFLHHNGSVPDVVSMSWGWAEDKQCDISTCVNITSAQYVERVNIEYAKFALRGVGIFVSSGDAGAPGRTSESCDETRPVNAAFPGSSPWVTSVGATFVTNSTTEHKWTSLICKENQCINGTEQVSISNDNIGWTAGGGFSNSSTVPRWQKKWVDAYLNSGVPLPNKFHKKGRAFPDVAVVGHNCPTYDSSSSFEPVDGTSCSSPIFASLVSLLNAHQVSKGKHLLGHVAPVLYGMAEAGVFNSSIVGHNYCTEFQCCDVRKDGGSDFGFVSNNGYDPVTGLGVPDVGKMLKWLDQNTV